MYHICGIILDTFKVIAFTHKNLPLELIGKLHLSQEEQTDLLLKLKQHFQFEELLFLSTCNRIELLIKSTSDVDVSLTKEIALYLNGKLNNYEATRLADAAEIYEGEEGIQHILKVASSLESLVVGEREIITQVRKAYDFCNELGLTGDFIRLVIRQTIETAKEIYTNTNIAKNPVSVASLAYRQLRELGIKNDARIVFVGSGETNTILANYFQKHKFANFTVFNRTLANGEKLAKMLNGRSFDLKSISTYSEGFDVLVVCTSSSEPVITETIFETLKANETSRKVIIDLGLPANVAETAAKHSLVSYIDINSLRIQAEINLQLRKDEVIKCEEIIKHKTEQFNSLYAERRIELAFGEVPKQVKAIKDLAVREVFAKEVGALDPQSKEVLEKVLSYMEKKYNAVAIKTAKEVFLSARN
ncbi:MAG: glutamyl-tRNA reductase [Bacteroidia bacterium]|nr:glutamyl-tRNA reductase [Bacteroidia bacterium]